MPRKITAQKSWKRKAEVDSFGWLLPEGFCASGAAVVCCVLESAIEAPQAGKREHEKRPAASGDGLIAFKKKAAPRVRQEAAENHALLSVAGSAVKNFLSVGHIVAGLRIGEEAPAAMAGFDHELVQFGSGLGNRAAMALDFVNSLLVDLFGVGPGFLGALLGGFVKPLAILLGEALVELLVDVEGVDHKDVTGRGDLGALFIHLVGNDIGEGAVAAIDDALVKSGRNFGEGHRLAADAAFLGEVGVQGNVRHTHTEAVDILNGLSGSLLVSL